MAAFLSDEWLAELAGALRAAPGLDGCPALALGQVVTGTPSAEGEEVAYTLLLGGGVPARVLPGTVEGAEVVLVASYATARAIASGTPAGGLLAEGKVKVRGDANALLAAQGCLAGLGEALAGLAATTHFEEGT